MTPVQSHTGGGGPPVPPVEPALPALPAPPPLPPPAPPPPAAPAVPPVPGPPPHAQKIRTAAEPARPKRRTALVIIRDYRTGRRRARLPPRAARASGRQRQRSRVEGDLVVA